MRAGKGAQPCQVYGVCFHLALKRFGEQSGRKLQVKLQGACKLPKLDMKGRDDVCNGAGLARKTDPANGACLGPLASSLVGVTAERPVTTAVEYLLAATVVLVLLVLLVWFGGWFRGQAEEEGEFDFHLGPLHFRRTRRRSERKELSGRGS